jgi:hypothetical protein
MKTRLSILLIILWSASVFGADFLHVNVGSITAFQAISIVTGQVATISLTITNPAPTNGTLTVNGFQLQWTNSPVRGNQMQLTNTVNQGAINLFNAITNSLNQSFGLASSPASFNATISSATVSMSVSNGYSLIVSNDWSTWATFGTVTNSGGTVPVGGSGTTIVNNITQTGSGGVTNGDASLIITNLALGAPSFYTGKVAYASIPYLQSIGIVPTNATLAALANGNANGLTNIVQTIHPSSTVGVTGPDAQNGYTFTASATPGVITNGQSGVTKLTALTLLNGLLFDSGQNLIISNDTLWSAALSSPIANFGSKNGNAGSFNYENSLVFNEGTNVAWVFYDKNGALTPANQLVDSNELVQLGVFNSVTGGVGLAGATVTVVSNVLEVGLNAFGGGPIQTTNLSFFAGLHDGSTNSQLINVIGNLEKVVTNTTGLSASPVTYVFSNEPPSTLSEELYLYAPVSPTNNVVVNFVFAGNVSGWTFKGPGSNGFTLAQGSTMYLPIHVDGPVQQMYIPIPTSATPVTNSTVAFGTGFTLTQGGTGQVGNTYFPTSIVSAVTQSAIGSNGVLVAATSPTTTVFSADTSGTSPIVSTGALASAISTNAGALSGVATTNLVAGSTNTTGSAVFGTVGAVTIGGVPFAEITSAIATGFASASLTGVFNQVSGVFPGVLSALLGVKEKSPATYWWLLQGAGSNYNTFVISGSELTNVGGFAAVVAATYTNGWLFTSTNGVGPNATWYTNNANALGAAVAGEFETTGTSSATNSLTFANNTSITNLLPSLPIGCSIWRNGQTLLFSNNITAWTNSLTTGDVGYVNGGTYTLTNTILTFDGLTGVVVNSYQPQIFSYWNSSASAIGEAMSFQNCTNLQVNGDWNIQAIFLSGYNTNLNSQLFGIAYSQWVYINGMHAQIQMNEQPAPSKVKAIPIVSGNQNIYINNCKIGNVENYSGGETQQIASIGAFHGNAIAANYTIVLNGCYFYGDAWDLGINNQGDNASIACSTGIPFAVNSWALSNPNANGVSGTNGDSYTVIFGGFETNENMSYYLPGTRADTLQTVTNAVKSVPPDWNLLRNLTGSNDWQATIPTPAGTNYNSHIYGASGLL